MLNHTLALAMEKEAALGEAWWAHLTENAHLGLQGKLNQWAGCTAQRWHPHSVTKSSLVTTDTQRPYDAYYLHS